MVQKVEQYLSFRRGLGYQLRIEGMLLLKFARYADAAGHNGPLTTELALLWARLPATGDPLYWARRLEIVRCFARHLAAVEPGTQIPPKRLLGPSHRRTTLRRSDLAVGPATSIRITGKGRKDRCVPLWKATAKLLVGWLAEIAVEEPTPLFPNRQGRALSRSGVEERLERAVSAATDRCPSLREKNISPHTFRHTTAMHLLQAGVDVTVIALWLGHESPETTHQYVEADVEMKRKILEELDEPQVKMDRRPKADELLDFLDGL
jgi:hypothetical protein